MKNGYVVNYGVFLLVVSTADFHSETPTMSHFRRLDEDIQQEKGMKVFI